GCGYQMIEKLRCFDCLHIYVIIFKFRKQLTLIFITDIFKRIVILLLTLLFQFPYTLYKNFMPFQATLVTLIVRSCFKRTLHIFPGIITICTSQLMIDKIRNTEFDCTRSVIIRRVYLLGSLSKGLELFLIFKIHQGFVVLGFFLFRRCACFLRTKINAQ